MINLSKEETTLTELVSRGKSNKEIAYELGLVESTVKNKLRLLYKKTGSRNRVELVIKFLKGEAQGEEL